MSSEPDREPTLWEQKLAVEPGHSAWYVKRFRRLAADGVDIVGEARTVDAMLDRRSRVLDAGCGPGRVGGHLHTVGHAVVGIDIDPVLIEVAEHDHPGPTWLVGDLSTLDLEARGIPEPFDAIVCAGNVLPFAAPSSRSEILLMPKSSVISCSEGSLSPILSLPWEMSSMIWFMTSVWMSGAFSIRDRPGNFIFLSMFLPRG